MLAACAPHSAAGTATALPITLTVFAAASLHGAFEEIGQTFEAQYPGVTVTFNFAGSQQLAQQLGQGAPADVFASANQKQMDIALAAGRVLSGTAQVFARNRLVVILPKDNPAHLSALSDLAKPGLKIVLAATAVPVGQYSLDFLETAGREPTFPATFKSDVLKNVMSYEENVRLVLGKVVLGEADAGIVYTSDVVGDNADQVIRLDIPDKLNVMASYPAATISDSAYPDMAHAFVQFVLSPQGQAILAKYGFIPVKA